MCHNELAPKWGMVQGDEAPAARDMGKIDGHLVRDPVRTNVRNVRLDQRDQVPARVKSRVAPELADPETGC